MIGDYFITAGAIMWVVAFGWAVWLILIDQPPWDQWK